MDTKIQIEKLNRFNYFTWKLKMELLLIKEDLWTVITSERDTSTRRAEANWDLRDNKARALIGLSIENNQLVHIRNKNSALEVWNSLREAHSKDTLTNRVSLYKQIALLKMKNGDKIEQHIDLMTELFQRLEDLGEEASEMWKIGMLFASLPKSYATLVTALEARNESDLTWSLVQTKLYDEYQRQVEDTEFNIDDQVLSISTKKFCRYCKRHSHQIQDCHTLKAKKERDARNSSLQRSHSDESIAISSHSDHQANALL